MEEGTVTEVTKKETTEVITPPNSGSSTASALSDVFSKIQAGKEEGLTSEEVISEIKAEPKKEEVTPAASEKKDEKKEFKTDPALEKKVEEKKEGGEEEVSREKLLEATAEKKAAKEEKKEEKKEDEIPEEELNVLPTDKPKTAKRIQALLKKIDAVNSKVATTETQIREKDQKLAELEKKLSEVKTVNPETDAKIKEQLDELAMFRRRYELDKDPEVKTKFDARVESAENSIVDILSRRNAGEPLLAAIKNEGGWQKFSNSGRIFSIADGEGGFKNVTASELAESILQALPLGERKQVEAAMVEQVSVQRDRDRYLKEQQETAVAFFKKREDEQTQRAQAEQQEFEAARTKLVDFEKRLFSSDFLKDKEIDPKASDAEKAAAESYNRYNAQLRSLAKKAINTSKLDGVMEIIEDSVRYYDERRTSASLREEVARLNQELEKKQQALDKFKGAGRTTPRAGSIAAPASSGGGKARGEEVTDISQAFDRIARGERVVLSSQDDDE